MAVLNWGAEMKLEAWHRLVLNALHDLSDASFQERIWLRHEGSQISSPIEAVNQLFDDSGLGDLLEEGAVVFSESADSTLREISKHVDSIDFEQAVEQLLADVRWLKLRQLTSAAIKEVTAVLAR